MVGFGGAARYRACGCDIALCVLMRIIAIPSLIVLVGCRSSTSSSSAAQETPAPIAPASNNAKPLPAASETVRIRISGRDPITELVCTSEGDELDLKRLELRFGSLHCSPETHSSWELAIKLPRMPRSSDGLATCPLPDAGHVDADMCADPGSDCNYLMLRELANGEETRKLATKRAQFDLEAWQPVGELSLDAVCGPKVRLVGSLTATTEDHLTANVSWNVTVRARQ
jgi:hypothetical protein